MILPPQQPRTSWPGLLARVALVLCLTSLVVSAVLLVVVLSPRWPDASVLWEGFPSWLVVPGVMVVGQALLLVGAPHWTGGRPRRQRAMGVSILVAALMAAGLTMGLIATFVSAVGLVATISAPFTVPEEALYLVVLPIWGVWIYVFSMMLRSPWQSRYGQMHRWLVRGTVLELAATVPVDVFVRRKTDCYCAEGTALALAVGLGSAGLLFGPGVALLMLRRRIQWVRPDQICFDCGYDLQGLTEPRCPECGRPFARAVSPAREPTGG